jgi:hypothetical protein
VSEPKPCAYAVDVDEHDAEVKCGEAAEFECCGEYYCSEHAHDWLDELEPGFVHEVSALAKEPG